MLAGFSFDLSRVYLRLGGGIKKSGPVWVANCEPNFRDVTTDHWPLRGDVSFLNRYPTEITILPFSVADVESDFWDTGLAKRIAKAMEEGYPAPVSALGIRYFDAKTSRSDTSFLGVTCGIKPSDYEIADKMFQRHLGRGDLMCNIGCMNFYGFSETDYVLPEIPTRNEFMSGTHYFATDNSSSALITFYVPKPPPLPPR